MNTAVLIATAIGELAERRKRVAQYREQVTTDLERILLEELEVAIGVDETLFPLVEAAAKIKGIN